MENSIPVLPFYKIKKMEDHKKRVMHKNQLESSDYSKLAKNNGISFISRPNLLSSYGSQNQKIIEDLYNVRAKYISEAEIYLKVQFDFIVLASKYDDQNATEYFKRISFNEELKTNKLKSCTENIHPQNGSINSEINKRSDFYIPPDNSTTTPGYLKNEIQFLDNLEQFSQKYTDIHYLKNKNNEDPIELPYNAISLADIPKTENNFVGGTLGSLGITLISFFGMLAEFYIYKSILKNLFEIQDGLKAIACGLTVLLLSKFIGFVLYNLIIDFIKRANKLEWSIKSSKFLILTSILVLLYTSSLGFIFYKNLEYKNTIAEFSMAQIQQQNLLDTSEMDDSADVQQEIQKNNKKIATLEQEISEQRKGSLIKGVTITFSSGLLLVLNAVIFSLALLTIKSVSLRRKMIKSIRKLTLLESRFKALKSRLHKVNQKEERLHRLEAEEVFIENLMNGGTPPQNFFSENNSNTILPLARTK
ncbi:MAG: hypothetical protein PSV16_00540 [Flavobacterium sp.]|nr:hypothetical protein [Flavobacterium sp.]